MSEISYCQHMKMFLYNLFLLITSCQGRIAVVGGGVGGTAAAYELYSEGLSGHQIDLYEFNEVGGRLATTTVNGREFETGGSIIHETNQYMKKYTQMFDFEEKLNLDSKEDHMALFNGEKFVFVESPNYMDNFLSFFMRYGVDSYSTFADDLMAKFQKIYQFQNEGLVVNNLEQLFDAIDVDFKSHIGVTLADKLRDYHGLLYHAINFLTFHMLSRQELYIDELVFLSTNVNYNQNPRDMHAFVGGVSLAPLQGQLWSVKGGNKKVPESLLKFSNANLIKQRIGAITLTNNSKYGLETEDSTELYDFVVLACPQIVGSNKNIRLEGFNKPINLTMKYQRTIATLVHGKLNYTYFVDPKNHMQPNLIFSVEADLFFNSVSVLYPVTHDKSYERDVFKVFSKKRLTEDQLDTLFSIRHSVTVVDWLAYPHYDVNNNWDIPFVVHKNLFYLNSFEWAASAMEISAIAGRNAALHIAKGVREEQLKQ